MAESRIRLDQPRYERRRLLPAIDPEAFGNWTERVARFLGTGRYLIVQSGLIILWVLWNLLAPRHWRFDPWDPTRFIFLTLMLSLQASYSAPLILLAQNRQDDRDRVNLDADREEARASKADLEYLARELAAVRMALGEVATRDFVRGELARLAESDGRARDSKKNRERQHSPESGDPTD